MVHCIRRDSGCRVAPGELEPDMTRTVAIAVLLFASAFASRAVGHRADDEKHPFTFDDYAALRSASPLAVAPDGKTMLCRIDFGAARGATRHEWKLVGADGGTPRAIEMPEHFTPFGFTRDGGLYGSYEINSVQQLATVPIVAGVVSRTPSRIVPLPRGIRSALISPDGGRFAVLASPHDRDPLDDVRTVVEPEQTSLYVVNTDGTGGSWWCGSLKNIADGPASGGALAWSRDSASLAVVSQTPKIGFKELRSFIDVCGANGPRRVADVPNAVSGIAWTGGGDELAFLSTTTNVLTPDHVWTVASAGGTPSDRTGTLAGSAMSLTGDPHGHVWVVVARGVQNELFEFAAGRLTPACRWPDGSVAGLPVFSELASAPAQIVVPVADPQHTANAAVRAGDAVRRVTTEGDDQVARIDLGPVRAVKWTSKEGIALEGIVTFPAHFQEGHRYPFLVFPHGGPEGNDQLVLDRSARFIAGLGYVVLQPQYRGSTGYGADFLQAIYQHFGDRAYRDVDSATDFAIAQGWADPNRLAMFGWSAGGFMTSWTVTQTGRYRAAIEGAGITDWASFMWTSDVQQWDYDARWPDAEPQAFTQFSAVLHADRVTTPLLVLHWEADRRVPTYQGRELYEALAARGKTTRMVTYPGSGHFPSLWEQRRDVFREIAGWLARYNR
jgi:dipeptidyl aminopeptidase/acylaminoacyl peptidase